ncbi:MAG: YqzG/YhdC family protein [Bacillaceae bacterium]|nr:YqzG/YhdC family protein [Bacillaceae bacterium]
MKRIIICLLGGFLLFTGTSTISATTFTTAQTPPAYAKWGKIAMERTKEKYPDAKIVDYLYVGSQSLNNSTVETFKLWLNENDREFGVFVTIRYDNKSEQIQHIGFRETDR